jgi:hypothetical protein
LISSHFKITLLRNRFYTQFEFAPFLLTCGVRPLCAHIVIFESFSSFAFVRVGCACVDRNRNHVVVGRYSRYPNQEIEDRLTIEWAAVPEGTEKFDNAWFEKSNVTRRVYLPVSFNR